jgi:hypothetical protein
MIALRGVHVSVVQPAQSRASQTQKMRSRFRSLGRFADTWGTASGWRKAKFSVARAVWGRTNAWKKPRISRIT